MKISIIRSKNQEGQIITISYYVVENSMVRAITLSDIIMRHGFERYSNKIFYDENES